MTCNNGLSESSRKYETKHKEYETKFNEPASGIEPHKVEVVETWTNNSFGLLMANINPSEVEINSEYL